MALDPLKTWVEAYGHAWTTLDAGAAAALFAQDATYQESPFAEPLRGRAAILEYWNQVARSQKQVSFSFEVISPERNIVHWRASFARVSNGVNVHLDGVFLLTFDSDGLCRALREWWMKKEVPGPSDGKSGESA